MPQAFRIAALAAALLVTLPAHLYAAEATGSGFCADWAQWDETRRARFIAVQADATLTGNYPDEAKELLRCVQPLAVAGIGEVTSACLKGDYAAGFMAGFIVAASLAECVSTEAGTAAPRGGTGRTPTPAPGD